MRIQKVLIDFSRFTDAELDQQAQAIVVAMTGNPHFLTPAPPLADVSDAIEDYQIALSNAASGDHAAVELKDQKRAALEEVLRQLGLYVEVQSNGDAAIMLSSGFHISKDPSPVGPLPKPTGFEIKPQGKGEIKLVLDKIDGARIYQFEYKQTAASEWINEMSTKTKLMLTGLESGKQYDFRVLPIGTSDIREYSDEISSFVL
jgi:hypothetical protein